jgi:hypothetical protein
MTPAELLDEAAAAGLRLELTPDGVLMVKPRRLATPEIVERLRAAKPELIAHLRRERLIEQAADKLRQHPALKRAAVIEPDGPGRYLAAVAVRMPDGIATAIVTDIRTDDGLLLLAALDRACAAPVQ